MEGRRTGRSRKATALVTRNQGLTLAAIVVWTLALIFGWVLQPLSDSMIVGFNEPEDGVFEAVVETTECNTVLSSSAVDAENLRTDFEFGFDYRRPPCEELHREARYALAINIVLILAAFVGWFTWVRQKTETARPADAERAV